MDDSRNEREITENPSQIGFNTSENNEIDSDLNESITNRSVESDEDFTLHVSFSDTSNTGQDISEIQPQYESNCAEPSMDESKITTPKKDENESNQEIEINVSSSKVFSELTTSNNLDHSKNQNSSKSSFMDMNSSLMNMDVSSLNISRKKVHESFLEEKKELNLSVSKLNDSPLVNLTLEKSINYSSIDMNSSLMNMEVSLLNMSIKKPEDIASNIKKPEPSNCSFFDKFDDALEEETGQHELNNSASEKSLNISVSHKAKLDVDRATTEQREIDNSATEKSLNYRSVDINLSMMNMDVSLLNMSRKKPEKESPSPDITNPSNCSLSDKAQVDEALEEMTEKYESTLYNQDSEKSLHSNHSDNEQDDDEALELATGLQELSLDFKMQDVNSETYHAEVLLLQSTNQQKTDLNVSSVKLNTSIEPCLDKSATEEPLNASFGDKENKEKSVLEEPAKALLDQSTNQQNTNLNVSSTKLNASVEPTFDKSATDGSLNASLGDKEKSILEEPAEALLDQSTNQQKTVLNLSSAKLNTSIEPCLDKAATEGSLNASFGDKENKEKSVLEQPTEILFDQSTNQQKTDLNVTSAKLNASIEPSMDKSGTEGSLNASLSHKEKSVLKEPAEALLDQSTNQQNTDLNVSSNKLNASIEPSLDKSATEGSLNASLGDKEKSVLEEPAKGLLDQQKTDLNVSSAKLNASIEPSLDKSATEGPLNASLGDKEKSVLEEPAEALLEQSTNQQKTDLNVSSAKLNASIEPSLDKSATEGPLNASLGDKGKSVLEEPTKGLLDQSTNQQKTDLNVSSAKFNTSIEPCLDKAATEGSLNASLGDKEKSVLEEPAEPLLEQSTNQQKTDLNVSSVKFAYVEPTFDKSATEEPLNASFGDKENKEKSVLEQPTEILLDQCTNQQNTNLNVSSTKLNASVEPTFDKSATDGSLNASLGDKEKSVLEEPTKGLLDQSTNQQKTDLNVSSAKFNTSIEPSLDKSATEGPLNASLGNKEKSVLEEPAEALLEQSTNQQKTDLNVSLAKLNTSIEPSWDKSATEEPLNAILGDKENKEKSVEPVEEPLNVSLARRSHQDVYSETYHAEVLLVQSTSQPETTKVDVSSTELNVSVPSRPSTKPLNVSLADLHQEKSEQHTEILLNQSTNQDIANTSNQRIKQDDKTDMNESPSKVEELSEKADKLGPLSKTNASIDNNIKTEKSLNSMDSSLTNLGVFPLDNNKKLIGEDGEPELNSSTQLHDSSESSIEILPLNQILEGIESIYPRQDNNVLNVPGEPELRSSTPFDLSPRRACSTIDEELESLVQDLSGANDSANDMINLRCPTPAFILREKLYKAEQIANRLRHDLSELSEFTTYEAQCMKSEKMASLEISLLRKKLSEAESTIAETNLKIESASQTNESLASQNKKLSKECDMLKIKLTDEEVRVELCENRWKKIVEELQNSLDEAWRVNTRPKLENIELTEYQIGFNQNQSVTNDLTLCLTVSESPEATRRNISMDEICTVKLDNDPNNSIEDPLKSTIIECIDDSDADSNFGTPLASQNGDNIDDYKNIEENVNRCLNYEEFDCFKIQKLLEEITGQKYLIENVASDFESMLDYITDKIIEGKKLIGYNTNDFFKQMIDSFHNHQSLKSAYNELNQSYNDSLNSIKSLESKLLENDKIKEAIKQYLPQQIFKNDSDIIKSIQKTKEEYDKYDKTFKSIQESINEVANYDSDIDSTIKSLINDLKDYDKTSKNTNIEITNYKTEINSIKNSVKDLASIYHIDENDVESIIKSIIIKKEKFDANYNFVNSENNLIKKSINQLAIKYKIDETNIDLIIESIVNKLNHYEDNFKNFDCLKTENSTLKESLRELASILNIDDNTDLIIESIKKMNDEFNNVKSELDCLKIENSTIKKSLKELASILNIDENNTDLMIESIKKMNDEFNNVKSELDCLKTENCTIKESLKELALILSTDDSTDLIACINKMIDELLTYKDVKSELDCLKIENSTIKESLKELAWILNIDENNTDLMIESIKKMNDEFNNVKSELDCLKTENSTFKDSLKELASILNIDENNTDLMIKSIKKMNDEFITYENVKSKLDYLKTENSTIKESLKELASILNIDENNTDLMIKSIKKMNDEFITYENVKSELDCLKIENSTYKKSINELASILNIDDNTDLIIKSIKEMNENQSELNKLKSEYNSIVKSVEQLSKYHNINEKNVDMIIKLSINKVEKYDSSFESLKLALDGEKSKNNLIKNSIKDLALFYNIDDDDIDSIIETIKKIVNKQDQKVKSILELINVSEKSENAMDIIGDKIQLLKENIESLSNDDNYYKSLEKELLDANDLKRTLAQELISLEPNLYKMHDLMRYSLKDLKDKIFSLFIEKEGELISQLQSKHEDELNSHSDKIKQIEEELKRKTAWTKKLEEDNDKLNNEYQQIKAEVSQLKLEIEGNVEIFKKKEENFNEEIRKLNNLLLLNETVQKSEECLKCNTLLQISEELKLQLEDKINCCLRHEGTIKETNKKIDNLIIDLNLKNNEIETSSRVHDHLKQKCTQLIDESTLMENDLKEKKMYILELTDRINKMSEKPFQSDYEVSTAKLEEYEMIINQLQMKHEDDLTQKSQEINEILNNLKEAENKIINMNADLVLKSKKLTNLEETINEKLIWEKKYKDLEIETKESRTRYECLSKNLKDDLKCKSLKITELDSLLKSANNSYQSSLSDKTNECERLTKKLEESKISYTRLENKIISQREMYLKEKQELSDYSKRLENENIQILNKFKVLLDCVSWDDAFAKLQVKISLCEELKKQVEEEKENNVQLDNENEILYTNIKILEKESDELNLKLFNIKETDLNKSESFKNELENYKKKTEEDFDKIKKLVEKNTFEEALQEIVNYINRCKNLQNELDKKINDIKQLDSENIQILNKFKVLLDCVSWDDAFAKLQVKISLCEELKKQVEEEKENNVQLDNENEILYTNIKILEKESDELNLKLFNIKETDLNKSESFKNELENYKKKTEEDFDKIKKLVEKNTFEEALQEIVNYINRCKNLQNELDQKTDKQLDNENIQILNKFKVLLDCVSWDDAFAKLQVKISLCEELKKQVEEEKENNVQLDNENEILYTNIKILEKESDELKLELFNIKEIDLNKSGSFKNELEDYKKKYEEDFDKIKKLVEKNTFEEALQEIVNYINRCKILQNELDKKINDIKKLDSENEILLKNIQDLQNELDEARLKIYENDHKLDTKTESIIHKLKSIQCQNISLEKQISKMNEICNKIKQIGEKDTIEEALIRIQYIINESDELQKHKKLYDSVVEKNQEMKLEIDKINKKALKYETMNSRSDNKIKGLVNDLEHCRVQIEKLEKEILMQQTKFDANIDKLSYELKQEKDNFTQYKHEINIQNEKVDTHTKPVLKESQQNEGSEGSNGHCHATEMLKNESIANLKSKLEKNKAVLQNKNTLIQGYKAKILELENLNQTYKTKLEYCGTEQVRPPTTNFQSDLLIKNQELKQTVELLKKDNDIIKRLADRRLKKLNDYEDYLKKIKKFPNQECENVSGSSKSNDRN